MFDISIASSNCFIVAYFPLRLHVGYEKSVYEEVL